MDEANNQMLKSKFCGTVQEVILPDFPNDDNTVTTTVTKSRRVSFGTNFVKEFIVDSAVSAQCVSEYEQAFLSSDSSNANSSYSAVEGGGLDHSMFGDENHKGHKPAMHVNPAPEPEENRPKIPKFASTICFSADSPTADMEFTEGCITLAKSILDKKDKEMTVIIQAKPKEPKDKGKQCKDEETKYFDGSQIDMSMTRCLKSKENKREERRFESEKTKIFGRYDDEMSITRCDKVFAIRQSRVLNDDESDSIGEDNFKENHLPLDMIMRHLDKDNSDLEKHLFNPEKSFNDVLNFSNESEKLNLNESMEISRDFQANSFQVPQLPRPVEHEDDGLESISSYDAQEDMMEEEVGERGPFVVGTKVNGIGEETSLEEAETDREPSPVDTRAEVFPQEDEEMELEGERQLSPVDTRTIEMEVVPEAEEMPQADIKKEPSPVGGRMIQTEVLQQEGGEAEREPSMVDMKSMEISQVVPQEEGVIETEQVREPSPVDVEAEVVPQEETGEAQRERASNLGEVPQEEEEAREAPTERTPALEVPQEEEDAWEGPREKASTLGEVPQEEEEAREAPTERTPALEVPQEEEDAWEAAREKASILGELSQEEDKTEMGEESEPPLVDTKVIESLREQSKEPGCVWSLGDMRCPQRKRDGFLSFTCGLLDSSMTIRFTLKTPREDTLDSNSVISGAEISLNEEQQLRLPEYQLVVEFGFQKARKHFEEGCRRVATIRHVSYFLDQMNSFTVKMNAYLRQVYSILTLYPGSRLRGPALSFRLFSFPIFFSSTASLDLTDLFRLSDSCLTFDTDFGTFNEARVREIFQECLKSENSLCEFVVRSTRYLFEKERESGCVSKRKHIRLLPPELRL